MAGQRNSPDHLPQIATALAAVIGIEVERLAEKLNNIAGQARSHRNR